MFIFQSSDWVPSQEIRTTFGLLKFSNFAMELVRAGISARTGAALVNALLIDLKEFFIDIIQDNFNVILADKCKIDRAMKKVRTESETKSKETRGDSLVCIGVDGKIDMTKCYEGKNLNRATKTEHHIVFTDETKRPGSYISHATLKGKATGKAEAEATYDVLDEFGSLDSVKAILLDNTATNTGRFKGLVACLERKLERGVHLLGCALHSNEIPLRTLFKMLDGVTTGPKQFSGPIGKKLSPTPKTKKCKSNKAKTKKSRGKKAKAAKETLKNQDDTQKDVDLHMKPQVKFECIDLFDITLEAKVLKDLSRDQRLLYEYCRGIRTGEIAGNWANHRIGPLNHARWLTLAIRILALYTRESCPSQNLVLLVKFIMGVYAPTWFRIKQSSQQKDLPGIILKAIEAMKVVLPDEHQEPIIRSLTRNSYSLLPDNFLYCMLMHEDENIRHCAIRRILSIRKGKKAALGNRLFIPSVNTNANVWMDLINWRDAQYEPASTCDISDDELLAALGTGSKKLNLPYLPSHSQSVERAIKLVSYASRLVYGFERRHQTILTILSSRKSRPQFTTKKRYRHFNL